MSSTIRAILGAFADSSGRAQHIGAVGRIGVEQELSGLPRPELGEPADQTRELVVRYGDDDQLAPPDHLPHVEHGDSGEDGCDALVVAATGDADDGVPGSAEGGSDHRADAAGADDADPESSVAPHDRSSVGSIAETGAVSPAQR